MAYYFLTKRGTVCLLVDVDWPFVSSRPVNQKLTSPVDSFGSEAVHLLLAQTPWSSTLWRASWLQQPALSKLPLHQMIRSRYLLSGGRRILPNSLILRGLAKLTPGYLHKRMTELGLMWITCRDVLRVSDSRGALISVTNNCSQKGKMLEL